jgi:hypothetical protein
MADNKSSVDFDFLTPSFLAELMRGVAVLEGWLLL